MHCWVLSRPCQCPLDTAPTTRALLLLNSWRKVGWIWAQSTKERDFIMSSEEICQCAAIQVSANHFSSR